MITTERSEFSTTGVGGDLRMMFAVNEGVPALHALTSASNLLSMIEEPVFEAAMGNEPLEHNRAWLAHHALESAKAIVDSLVERMEMMELEEAEKEKTTKAARQRRQGLNTLDSTK